MLFPSSVGFERRKSTERCTKTFDAIVERRPYLQKYYFRRGSICTIQYFLLKVRRKDRLMYVIVGTHVYDVESYQNVCYLLRDARYESINNGRR